MAHADAGCAGLVATQGMIHVGVIAPTHFLNSRGIFYDQCTFDRRIN